MTNYDIVQNHSDHPEKTSTFIRLFTASEHRIRAYILAILPKWTDAEDVFQETAIRLWEQFENYDPSLDFTAWACGIAKYMALAQRAKNSRSKLLQSDEFLRAVSDEFERQTDSHEVRNKYLEGCINELHPDHQKLVRGYYSSQKQIAALAQEMGKSTVAIYRRLSRIRHTLFQCVERKIANLGAE